MRPLRSAATALALAAGCVVLGPVSASAEEAPVPGTMSTAAVNTTRFDIPVPRGVVPSAITGVLTMPEVVNNGAVTFRVNGRIARTVPSTLYAKVRIPVTAADVIADGTIGLTMASQGPAVGGVCRPAAGEASLRKIALTYRGKERLPTSLANFFPPSSNRIDVLIAADADDDLLEAGVAAVAALSSRYPDGTEIALGALADAPTTAVASQRVVVLSAGRPGEVTTDIAAAPRSGVPVLTITANGDDLPAAAKALAVTEGGDTLQLANDPAAEGISGELGKREPDLERSLADVGAGEVRLSGYGVTAQAVKIPQDAFSSPVSGLEVHLQGAHTAVADADRARLDVRMNGELVGSKTLDDTGALEMDFSVPAGKLRSVNELQLVLSAVTVDGLPCAAPGSPPIEVDLDTQGSTLTATAGTADTGAFQLWPQVLQGSLPVAVRNEGAQRFGAVQELARVVGTLQRAASFPLDVQLVPANAFIADDRSGIIIGASAADATSLEAPLKLSSIRLLDQADSSFEVTSQEPYAVLEAIGPSDGADRQVLMLGGWAPGNQPAPRALTTKLVSFLVSSGWPALDGDLLLTDDSAPPFTVDSTTLAQEQPAAAEAEERSYAKWFVAGVALLLMLLAFQVLISIRRDRRVAQAETEDLEASQPAYLEDLEFREQNLTPSRPADEAPAPPTTSPSAPPPQSEPPLPKPPLPKPSPPQPTQPQRTSDRPQWRRRQSDKQQPRNS
ncbi:cellulose biosynthesis cyclic di-GMP-binding regulatory protein BcsB [Nocardioides dilutus]